MTARYYVDSEGAYLGAFDGVAAPQGATEVPSAPEDARQVWSGGAWTWPKPVLHGYLAETRWRIETGGTSVGGVEVETTDRSKLLIAGAKDAAVADGDATFKFAAVNGRFTLSAAEIISVHAAVSAFVQGTFDAADTIASGIEAGTVTTPAEIRDHAAWTA